MLANRGIRNIFTSSIRATAVIDKIKFKDIIIKPEDLPDVQVRNRPFLSGSTSLNLPKIVPKQLNKYLKTIEFQTDSKGDTDFEHVGKTLREYLDKIFEKNYHAVYIRNLPFTSPKEFDNLVTNIGYRPMTYRYGSGYREKIENVTYNSTDEPPEFCIEAHNEMSYVADFPTKVILGCIEAADEGGENPIVFNRDLMERLDKAWMDKTKKRKVRYSRNVEDEQSTDYISWQRTFETDSKKVAEKLMTERDWSWKWWDNGNLTMWYTLENFLNHPKTGEEIFFNQITASHHTYYKSNPMFEHQQELLPSEYPFNSTYGDGEEFEEELLDHIRSVSWNCAVPLKLQPGDIIVLDNLFVQHSRMSFKGRRKLVVQMVEGIEDIRKDLLVEQ